MSAGKAADQAPELSVILVTDTYRTIRPVIERLRGQRVPAQLEIVLVVPRGRPLELEPVELEAFGGVQLVEVDTIVPLARARAAGVRAATGRIVVVGETHSFPHPDWADALIEAHTQPWAVVVPAFSNANPDSALSWAALLKDYGLWVEGRPAGVLDRVPAYNTAAKREVLLEFGGQLEEAVGQSDVLAVGLRSRGHQSYFEPAAVVDHANVSEPSAWLAQRLLAGRAFGAGRSHHWSWLRRLLYAGAGPLIPAVILYRLIVPLRRIRRLRKLPVGTLPALVMSAVLTAAGEVVSYIAGTSEDTLARCDEYELYKLRYTSLGIP